MKPSTTFLAGSALIAAVAATPSLKARATTVTNSNTPQVTVQGNAFFANGQRFYIRGVDYQPGGSSNVADPIADVAGCTRDVPEFKKLGINTVRVYTVDNTANHDQCMELLANAGIYLALDVNTPNYSLNRASETAIQISYNADYLQSVFATIDTFAKYENTLLFFSANEVINDNFTSFAAPYVKAVTRDMKSYISARGYRTIPVGYSAADISSNRLDMAEYMNCGDPNIRGDFFAFNDYSWCDPSSFTQSGWSQKVQAFTGYSVPLFLSEYGCNTNTRTFQEVGALYSTEMTSVYSGGLVYEYSQETNNYGLVQINSDGSVSELPDYAALQSAYSGTPNPTGDGGYLASGTPDACPTMDPPAWVVGTTLIPTMPAGAQKYLTGGAGAGPGLSTTGGSQNSGSTFNFNATTGGSAGTSNGGSNSTGGSKKSDAVGPRIPLGSIAGLIVAGLVAVLML